jgi:hypothetical protein
MMRCMVAVIAVLGVAGMAFGADDGLGSRMSAPKSDSHVRTNPGTPDGREGGETVQTAVRIASLPFTDHGNTCDNIDDYDYACPYAGSTSPDVVYVYRPSGDMLVRVDLCLSLYDTKVYVYEDAVGTPIACNDDYYFDPPCHGYTSYVDCLMRADHDYYIAVDGYDGDCGDYVIEVAADFAPPPVICPPDGVLEGEPELYDGYTDSWNAGCGSDPPSWNVIYNWQTIDTDCGWLCGSGGWFLDGGGIQSRDTDWYPVTAAGTSMTMTVWSPHICDILVLNSCYPTCEPAPTVLYSADTSGGSGTLTWATTPGEQFVLWVGSDVFSPPGGGTLGQFDYLMEVCGQMSGVIAAEHASWGSVKSLYR